MGYRKAPFAGRAPWHPEVGDPVRVLEGDHKGQTVTVVDLGGNAYALAFKIFVRTQENEIVWYWPWNLEPTETGDVVPQS